MVASASKAMADLGVVGVPLAELQGDRPLANVNDEFTITAVIVFPAVVFLFKVVVTKRLNRRFEREFGRCRLRLPSANLVDREVRCGKLTLLICSEAASTH